jgi:hypothetical protein
MNTFVILSEAKDLLHLLHGKEIPRYARNDNRFSYFVPSDPLAR